MVALERKQWQIYPPAPQAFLARLSSLHPLVAQILYNRGLTTPEEATALLSGTLAKDNPFQMGGMAQALPLVRRAIERGELIVIYGDYDTDGVTATAILMETLTSLGARVEPYIPDRLEEGYGLNLDALDLLAQKGVKLLITVDCGIRSLAEVAHARQQGMAVIVTDHHHPGPALPTAEAVVNPRCDSCPYPFKTLAGAGVAFKLAQALLRSNRQVPLRTTQKTLEETALLDLVALGTVADMVPLLGENHVLVRRGLVEINAARRPGLSALMQVANLTPGRITSTTIGYVIAPRLNAAGRISQAQTALQLLLAPDMDRALPLAEELEHLNRERQALTAYVQERARMQVLAQEEIPPLLFAAATDFPPGVIGLAAGRLSDEFYRPTVVVAIEGEFSKGSARSILEFHITEALDTMAELLVRHGGHAAAAGFTVRTERLPELQSRLLASAQAELGGRTLVPTLNADAEIPLSTLSPELHQALLQLEPFGYGNLPPLFISRRARVLNARAVGADGRHLKLFLADERGTTWDAIAFGQGDWIGRLPRNIDLAYTLEINEWNGTTRLQLNVQDIHA